MQIFLAVLREVEEAKDGLPGEGQIGFYGLGYVGEGAIVVVAQHQQMSATPPSHQRGKLHGLH